MATLNTLRTKYGIVLSIVIAVVLLAFILGDQLNNRQGPQQYEDFASGSNAPAGGFTPGPAAMVSTEFDITPRPLGDEAPF